MILKDVVFWDRNVKACDAFMVECDELRVGCGCDELLMKMVIRKIDSCGTINFQWKALRDIWTKYNLFSMCDWLSALSQSHQMDLWSGLGRSEGVSTDFRWKQYKRQNGLLKSYMWVQSLGEIAPSRPPAVCNWCQSFAGTDSSKTCKSHSSKQ